MSKAQREAEAEIQRKFWSMEKSQQRFKGRPADWKEYRHKVHIIERAIDNGTIDADEVLDKYDLVKYL